MTKKKVLILFAHPSLHRSEVNAPLFKAANELEDVTCVDLYAEYPTMKINIDREQQRLLDHDVVIFQFPLYWYSTPSILKEWQDLVLEYGFAYGTDGTALHGKTLMCAISAGGRQDAYHAQGYNHFTIRQLLTPIEQMTNLIGMNYLAPFALFGSRTALEDGRIPNHVEEYIEVINALSEDRIDIEIAKELNQLNTDLNKVIKEA